MAPNEALSVSVTQRGSAEQGSDPVRIVVWVRGEHDVATRNHVAAVLAGAARLGAVDVVVDLSETTFMDASTISAVVEAHNRLRSGSRSLSVRAPSPIARRLLDVCGLGFLIDGPPAPGASVAALDSWVAVPASDPAAGAAPAPGRAPDEPEDHVPTAPPPSEVATPVPPQWTPA